ncbi:Esterase/lipase/thioesterase [Heterobasidion irregulare TC 32-1]|uniref:Esterase/lipase/thioesterase n=1 Tax=Heterobasidion irregulare (strain TC 32-1) TaxID=747525 RepID=W4K6K7_HETIT|nr:Esterase/lipase/thioesterase [Heterobasidion irregulare TC 32-1]ETW81374.1 Esterase/lipase/thioesterase [Heterobasidion irregulare TC 32-1]
MPQFSSLTIDDSGKKLSYIDSGAPDAANGGSVYTTIIAVHGIEFTSPIFNKVSALAGAAGMRFVAVNRREYKGSTPFSDAEKAVLTNGTDEQKLQWLRDRGNELATGGVALLGWSMGVSTTIATIANVDSFAPDIQLSLGSHLRAHIMHEPPTVALGLPRPPKLWTPRLDESLPMKTRISYMTRWLTSYFAHGDLSTRDLDAIEYVLPSTSRIPTLWNMSSQEIADIVDEGPHLVVDAPLLFNCYPQAAATYKKGTYNAAARALLPKMKIWELMGDATAAVSLCTFWILQDDDAAHGGGFINFKVIPGHNHFDMWDDPKETLQAYLEMLA